MGKTHGPTDAQEPVPSRYSAIFNITLPHCTNYFKKKKGRKTRKPAALSLAWVPCERDTFLGFSASNTLDSSGVPQMFPEKVHL